VSSLARALAWLTTLGSVVAALATAPGEAAAEERAGTQRSERERAAEAYDRGVQAFDRGEPATAARHFLEADALAPSTAALSNAVAAAAQAGERALLSEAVARATERRATEPELAESALAAWAELERAPARNAATPVASGTPATTVAPRAPAEQEQPAPATTADGEQESGAPVLLYASAATTAVLVGLTTWSGLDALAARRRLPGSQADNDAVMARAHRTDALLAGTAVLAGLTVVLGIRELRREASAGRPEPWVGVTAGGALVGVKGSL
jgi:hypothetical protein